MKHSKYFKPPPKYYSIHEAYGDGWGDDDPFLFRDFFGLAGGFELLVLGRVSWTSAPPFSSNLKITTGGQKRWTKGRKHVASGDLYILYIPRAQPWPLFLRLWPLFLKVNPSKQGLNFDQDKGYLGSRYWNNPQMKALFGVLWDPWDVCSALIDRNNILWRVLRVKIQGSSDKLT